MRNRRLLSALLMLALLCTLCPIPAAVTAEEATVVPTVIQNKALDYMYTTTGGLENHGHYDAYYNEDVSEAPSVGSLHKNADGTYSRVEFKDPVLYIEYYDENFLLMPEKTRYKRLPLPRFGGVYYGEQYNYILVGDEKGTDKAEQYGVFALCQYDKDWNLLGVHKPDEDLSMVQKAIYLANVSYAEAGDLLYIHTGFQMVGGIWDSGAHQGCISFCFNQETAEFKAESFFDASHSLNQFIICDDQNYYSLDHCDGPRSMLLFRVSLTDSTDNDSTEFMRFGGPAGDVYTGAMAGGMAFVGDRIVTTVSTIDQEYVLNGGTHLDQQYNVGVFSYSKDFSEYKEVWLTDYPRANRAENEEMCDVSVPYLVPTGGEYAYVVWQEIRYPSEYPCVCIAKIDSYGNQVGETCSIYGNLSSVRPFYEDGYLYWYHTGTWFVDRPATFYKVDVSRLEEYHHDGFVDISTLSAELDTYEVISIHPYSQQQKPQVIDFPYGPRGAQLTEGTDYKITYENDLKPGTAQVVITGKGLFQGEKRVDFQVVHHDISTYLRLELRPNRVTFDPTVFYNPDPEYALYDKDGNRVSVTGVLTRNGNMWAAGTVLFTFTATDLRENGSLTAEYIIDPVPAEDVRIDFNGGQYQYTGQPITPDVTVWYKNTRVDPVQTPFGSTTEYTNYTVTYENNVEPGTAKAIVHFQGNYSGTRELTFTIKGNGTTPDDPGQGDGATLGDVDKDGQITSTDARLVLQFYAGKIKETSLDLSQADVDGDKQITSTDARLILQKYAGKIKEFPKK